MKKAPAEAWLKKEEKSLDNFNLDEYETNDIVHAICNMLDGVQSERH